MAELKNKLPPIHPGEILKQGLDEIGLSARAFCEALAVPFNRIAAIIREERAITPDTALRLARYFNTTAEFWMGLQQYYDLKQTERQHGKEIRAAVKPHAA